MRSHHQDNIGVDQDTKQILRFAKRRWPEAHDAHYEGCDEERGNVWCIRDKNRVPLGKGWFDADAQPHFTNGLPLTLPLLRS